ncbi:MAG TPA: secretin N-terminal domain-containing protein [Pyrinomonadaceae bacterium]|nr:secretin N-terminal domain-containing protein [Pyrinomonadaceae bacterium]
MFSFKLRIIAAFALALGCAHVAAAQQSNNQQPAATQDRHVTHGSFKNRVFELKYRDPETLYSVIELLTSGHKGAQVSFNRNFRTLTVRDFPENLATIEEALKRLDTPETPRPEIELRMHVLIASNAAGGANQYPPDLRDAVGQLQTTLNFKSYHLLTSIIQRAKDRPGPTSGLIQGEGVAQLTLPGENAPRDFHYTFQANSLTLSTSPAGVTTVQLGNFTFGINGKEGDKATLRSDVGVRDGERVVVGTAGLRDKALILVLAAKLIK